MEPPPISHPSPGVSARCDQPPIQLAIHRRLTLLASIVTIAMIAPTTALIGMPVAVPLASLVYGLVMAWLYRSARRGRHYTAVTFALTLLVIAGGWFPSSGSLGSALLYHGAALVYGMVVLRGRQQTIGVAALLFVALTLLGLEYAWPGLLSPPPTAEARMIQLSSGVILGTGLAALDGEGRERGLRGGSGVGRGLQHERVGSSNPSWYSTRPAAARAPGRRFSSASAIPAASSTTS